MLEEGEEVDRRRRPTPRPRREGGRTRPPAAGRARAPAESSTSSFQRASSAATRRAIVRSGVTTAIVAAPSSSASRMAIAMPTASSCSLRATRSVDPGECDRDRSGRRLRGPEGGPSLGRLGRAQRLREELRPHRRRGVPRARAGPRPRARCRARRPAASGANCGCPKAAAGTAPASPIAAQPASSSCWSRPGSTTAPFGSRAIALSSSAVAGIEPVEPAAMIGAVGLSVFRRSAAARISVSRRSTGSTRPSSAR